MQVKLQNKIYGQTAFQGRVQMPPEKFFTKMIDGMEILQRQKVESRLLQEIERNKQMFKDFKAPIAKTLKGLWKESLEELKMLVTEKLPDEYVLTCKQCDTKKDLISFSLVKGEEYVYGGASSIINPHQNYMKKAIEILSNPESKEIFGDLKKLIPDLTENNYIINNSSLNDPNMLERVKVYKKLKQEAIGKGLKLSLQCFKDGYSTYSKAKGTIKNQYDHIIWETPERNADFSEVAAYMSHIMKGYPTLN